LSKAITQDIGEAQTMLDQGITVAGVKNEALTKSHVLSIAETFEYQWYEGDSDNHPGYRLIVAIVANLENNFY
jgi:hypothetical protein